MLKGLRVEGAIASILFRIPILAQMCHWFGSRYGPGEMHLLIMFTDMQAVSLSAATTRNIHKLLDEGSVGLMAGGIAEIFLSSREHEVHDDPK